MVKALSLSKEKKSAGSSHSGPSCMGNKECTDPPGLTEKEAAILTKAKRRAYRLDLSLGSFFGIRCGWGAVIGLIPGIGDVLDMLLCLMVYRTICSVEPSLDSSLKMKMKFNIIIDFFIGLIPFA